MHERLKRALLKYAEEVGDEKSSEYLAARKGKVPVDPPASPEDDGESSYPDEELKKDSALHRTALNLLKYAQPMPPGMAPGGMPPQGGMPPGMAPGGMPPGMAPGGMPPPPPPMPPQGGMPPGMAPGGMPPGGMPPDAQVPIPPEIMQRLEQHLLEHQMMEQAGMMDMGPQGGPEEGPQGGPEEAPLPPAGEMGVPPPQMPEQGMPIKQAAINILKDRIFG